MPTTSLVDLRYQQFATKVFVQGKPASHAYSEIYGTDKNSPSTWSCASRLLKHAKVRVHSDYWRYRYLLDAEEAYRKQWQLALDPSTPAAVSNAIYNSIQDRAGLAAPRRMTRAAE